MFYDLKAIKRNVYQPGTQILVKSFGKTDQHIWKHFFKIIKILDIPAFFIQVQTNNSELKSLLYSLIEKVIPWEKKINVIKARYIKTPKNEQVKEFYDKCSFSLSDEDDSFRCYTLAINNYMPKLRPDGSRDGLAHS